MDDFIRRLFGLTIHHKKSLTVRFDSVEQYDNFTEWFREYGIEGLKTDYPNVEVSHPEPYTIRIKNTK